LAINACACVWHLPGLRVNVTYVPFASSTRSPEVHAVYGGLFWADAFRLLPDAAEREHLWAAQ